MKNLLILLVALALYLHFYPESDVSVWLQKQKDVAIEKFNDIADTKVRLSASKVYKDIENQFDAFSTEEQNYVKEITQSRKSIIEFFNTHCNNSTAATQLHYENQKKVCSIIGKYQSFF